MTDVTASNIVVRAIPAINASLLNRFEQGPRGGFSGTWYMDEGVPCIGWGHRIVNPADPLMHQAINADQANALALSDLQIAARELTNDLTAELVTLLSDGQWAALIDFCFNEGIGRFRGSTMHKLIVVRDFDAAANEFNKWIYARNADGVELPVQGLIDRRAVETQLWTGTLSASEPLPQPETAA